MTRLVNAALQGDFPAALVEHNAMYPLMKAMFVESNPAPIKAAMAKMGWLENELRLPLCPVSPTGMSVIEEGLAPFLDELESER